MGQVAPTHPAVVLRSQFNQLRALLAVALIAVIGLTAGIIVVGGDDDQVSSASTAGTAGHINYGGFNPATGRPESAPLVQQEQALPSSPAKDYSQNSATGDVGTPGPVKDYSQNSATGDVR